MLFTFRNKRYLIDKKGIERRMTQLVNEAV